MQNKLIQLDFDGTVVTRNIGMELQEKFASDQERFYYLRDQFEKGEMDVLSVIKLGWENIRTTEGELSIAAFLAKEFRKGFHFFLAKCWKLGFIPVVVSGGMDFYMQHISVRQPVVIAGKAIFTPPNRVSVFMPCNLKLAFAHQYHPLVYIGDVRTDVEPSKCAKYVFGVEGGKLAENGKLARQPKVIPFTNFDTITDMLDTIR